MSPDLDELEGPLEEERWGRGRHRKDDGVPIRTRGWKGSLAQRARVAKRLPQAVLKVTSHNKGRRNTLGRLLYISRDASLPLETDEGLTLKGKAEIEQLVNEWSLDFALRNEGRDAVSMVLSVPPGLNRKATRKSAAEFLKNAFAPNYPYAFAEHDDKDHFHIHVVIKMRGQDGRQLRTNRFEIRTWREQFAECGRANGLQLDASPRFARGKGRKGTRGVVQMIRDRGLVPRVDQAAASEALRSAKTSVATDAEARIRQSNARERTEYARQAAMIASEALKLRCERERLQVIELATEMATFAETMPAPRTRREALRAAVGLTSRSSTPGARESQKWTRRTEQLLRDVANSFEDPTLRRQATAATYKLSALLGRRDRHQGRDREVGR